MAEEISVIRKICDHINAWEGAPCLFLPESREGSGTGRMPAGKKLPAGAVTALSGPVKERFYVDGSFAGQIPFAVYLRVQHTPGDGLEALEWFGALSRYLGTFAPSPDAGRIYGCCEPTTLPARSSVDGDGTEEYRASYAVPCRGRL